VPFHLVQLAPGKTTATATLQTPAVADAIMGGMTTRATVETTVAITPSLKVTMEPAVMVAETTEATRIVAAITDRITTRSARARQLRQTPRLEALYLTE
jgi:hypothetical protein